MIKSYRRLRRERKQAEGRLMARESNRVQQENRSTRDVDFDTTHRRALHDAKGQTIREGCTYTTGTVRPWLLRRSLHGRTDQVDLLIDGAVVRTCGRCEADSAIRWMVWTKKHQQSSCYRFKRNT